MSFIKQFITSIYRFHDYGLLVLNRGRRVVCYYFLFTLLTAVLSIGMIAGPYKKAGGITGIFDKYVPEFSIDNGKLNCETIDKEISGVKVYINTNDKFDFEDKIGNSQIYFVADGEKFAVNNGVQSVKGEFSDIEDINRQQIKDLCSSGKFKAVLLSSLIIMLWLNEIMLGIVSVTMLALVGNLINIFVVKAQLKMSDLYKVSVYARTFPVLLSSVVAIFGIQLNIIVYTGLLITYMYLGLKNIKSGSGIILAEI